MDFPDLTVKYFEGINYKLSDLFERSYYDDFVIHDNAEVKTILELSIYFTVEKFSEDEALEIQYNFENEIQLLNAVHDMYSAKRINTLEESAVSIKKEVPKSVGYPGYIQVISGSRFENESQTTYFMATLEIDDAFYVFQLIGKKENMGYLHDDFIDLLSSVK